LDDFPRLRDNLPGQALLWAIIENVVVDEKYRRYGLETYLPDSLFLPGEG
jgi:hypothetical protein